MTSAQSKALQLFEEYQAKNGAQFSPNTLIEAVSELIGLKGVLFNNQNNELLESDSLSPEDQKRLNNISRGWNGKLKRIDDLLSWMYDKGVLNKGEKAEKDRLFKQYYRWYNDGDVPLKLKRMGFDKYNMRISGNDNLLGGEAELEKMIDGFISKILTKYLPKINRKNFRIDTAISDLKMVHSTAKRMDISSLIFWVKRSKTEIKPTELVKLEELYTKFTKEFNSAPEKEGTNPYDGLRNKVYHHLIDSVDDMSKEQLKIFRSYDLKLRALVAQYEDTVKATIDGLEKIKSELKK